MISSDGLPFVNVKKMYCVGLRITRVQVCGDPYVQLLANSEKMPVIMAFHSEAQ